ncbi:Pyruvate, phosphate dikinase, chloroplastic [Linum perenne]
MATGLPASPGTAVGRVTFSAEPGSLAQIGKNAILVRTKTSLEDVEGMHAAAGILTARGGMTSHTAVVARDWGLPMTTRVLDPPFHEFLPEGDLE